MGPHHMHGNIKFKKPLQEFEQKFEPYEALRFKLGKSCAIACDRNQAHVEVEIATCTVKGTCESCTICKRYKSTHTQSHLKLYNERIVR